MHEGAERAALWQTAQHYPNHPGYGHAVLAQCVPPLERLLQLHSDDPAIAACQIIDVLPSVIPQLERVLSWARSLNTGDPYDIPEKGARLPSKVAERRGDYDRVHQTPA